MAKKRRPAPKAKKPSKLRVLVVEARYYEHIADMLLSGAMRVLDEAGVEVTKLAVPGALEIAPAIAMATEKERYDGAIALGCVIQGQTFHFDIVAMQSARALMDIAVAQRLPCGNGILTVDNEPQALARAQNDKGGKGAEAARACLSLIAIKQGAR